MSPRSPERTRSRRLGTRFAIDKDDIGGIVTGPRGPEAGVWVIAETGELPTSFVKIVVTDDQGRYLIPDLPTANYDVWVRGYGLVDSPKVKTAPGKNLNLSAVVAPNPQAAAQYYPAGYWLSLIRVPDKRDFPGTGPEGNGIAPAMKSQSEWISRPAVAAAAPSAMPWGARARGRSPRRWGRFRRRSPRGTDASNPARPAPR